MTEYSASFCPRYLHAVELIGKRWSGVILRTLLLGASRFTELRDSIPDLSDRMLNERLVEFEREGLVTREVSQGRPVRITYRLTPKGRALESAVSALSAWADEWVDPAQDVAGLVADRR